MGSGVTMDIKEIFKEVTECSTVTLCIFRNSITKQYFIDQIKLKSCAPTEYKHNYIESPVFGTIYLRTESDPADYYRGLHADQVLIDPFADLHWSVEDVLCTIRKPQRT